MKKTKQLLIGITGAIGSGKSTLARIYAEAGYPVLSADQFARELTVPGAPALAEIQRVFGVGALAADGSLDRGFLRAEIIRDSGLRKKLEAILHPKIQELTRSRSSELFQAGREIVFYEAPLLFEANSEHHMDFVICVHAPEAKLVERVMKRDGCGREQAEKLLASQMPQAEKMARADYIIENNADEAALRAAAFALLEKLKTTPSVMERLKRKHRLAMLELGRFTGILKGLAKK